MNDEDIIERLYDAAGIIGENAYLSNDGIIMIEAADEIKRLRRWKAMATEILARWDAVADTIEIGPNQLGLHKYDIVHAELQALRASCEGYFAASREWRDEYRTLHTLVREWADAEDGAWGTGPGRFEEACDALRKAVGR